MTEQEIVKKVYIKIKNHDNVQNVFIEIPFLSKCIDMVILQDSEIISIEFKLKDWRRAIHQAENHLFAVDKSYICLPHRFSKSRIFNKIKEDVKKKGVGLLFFDVEKDYPLKRIIPASKSSLLWKQGRKQLLERLEYFSGGDENNER